MIFKNAMSFKAKMKQVAVEKGLTAQGYNYVDLSGFM